MSNKFQIGGIYSFAFIHNMILADNLSGDYSQVDNVLKMNVYNGTNEVVLVFDYYDQQEYETLWKCVVISA